MSKPFLSESKDFKTLQYYRMCDTTIHADCINYDKFNQLIADLNESVETNKHVIQRVEGERCTITYLIQQKCTTT